MERKNTEKKNTEKKSTENKKDKAFVAVVSGLTSNQAGELARALINAKQRYAPKSRGTIDVNKKPDRIHKKSHILIFTKKNFKKRLTNREVCMKMVNEYVRFKYMIKLEVQNGRKLCVSSRS